MEEASERRVLGPSLVASAAMADCWRSNLRSPGVLSGKFIVLRDGTDAFFCLASSIFCFLAASSARRASSFSRCEAVELTEAGEDGTGVRLRELGPSLVASAIIADRSSSRSVPESAGESGAGDVGEDTLGEAVALFARFALRASSCLRRSSMRSFCDAVVLVDLARDGEGEAPDLPARAASSCSLRAASSLRRSSMRSICVSVVSFEEDSEGGAVFVRRIRPSGLSLVASDCVASRNSARCIDLASSIAPIATLRRDGLLGPAFASRAALRSAIWRRLDSMASCCALIAEADSASDPDEDERAVLSVSSLEPPSLTAAGAAPSRSTWGGRSFFEPPRDTASTSAFPLRSTRPGPSFSGRSPRSRWDRPGAAALAVASTDFRPPRSNAAAELSEA